MGSSVHPVGVWSGQPHYFNYPPLAPGQTFARFYGNAGTPEFVPPSPTVDIPGISGSISSTVHPSRQLQLAVRFKF